MSVIFFDSYIGLGDNVYMRPFVKDLCEKNHDVYVKTGFPEIFQGLPVKCVKPTVMLKSYVKKLNDSRYVDKPLNARKVHFDYHKGLLEERSIVQSFLDQSKVTNVDFKLPVTAQQIKQARKKLKLRTKKKVCLLKLPTVRDEWVVTSRNSKMEHFQRLISAYSDKYYFISISDNQDGEQFSEFYPEGISKHFNQGELSLDELIGAIYIADCVIGCPSFILPLTLAIGTPLFLIYGGYVANRCLVHGKMNLEKYGYIEPEPFCFCNRRTHKCNKEIDEQRLYATFEAWEDKVENCNVGKPELLDPEEPRFEAIKPQGKGKLLVSRLRAWRVKEMAENVGIQEAFEEVVGLDTDSVGTYTSLGLRAYNYKDSTRQNEIQKGVEQVIEKEGITHCIIAQKLHTLADATYNACVSKGVKVLWSEAFFDDKLLFDYNGLPYTPDNDIRRFAKHHTGKTIVFPQKTRQPQPLSIRSLAEMKTRYNLGTKPNIVLFAQVVWDMSLKTSINKAISTYEEFLRAVIEGNRHANIIIKPHPQCSAQKYAFVSDYPNVKICNESLDTLFECFDYFVTFSSTTAFEAVVKNKHIAICGHTLVSDDRLVLQARTPEKLYNLDTRLRKFSIDKDYRAQHLSFLTTKYAIGLKNPLLAQKLLKVEEVFYKECLCLKKEGMVVGSIQ